MIAAAQGWESPAHRRAGLLAAALGALAMTLSAVGIVLHVVGGQVPAGDFGAWWVTNAVAGVVIALPGALLAARRPANPLGWLLLGLALTHGLTAASREYALHALVPGSGLPAGRGLLWASNWLYSDFPLLIPLFFLFPDGRLPSRRWLVVLIGAEGLALVATVWLAVQPGPLLPSGTPVNPTPWPTFYAWIDGFDVSLLVLLGAALGVGVLLMALRAAAARGPARRSIVLVALAGALLAAEIVHEDYVQYPGEEYVGAAVMLLFALSVALAILRYGLYEIDFVVSRTVVYGGLTILLGGAYVAVVAFTQKVIGNDELDSVPAAILVVLLFAPARTWLQRVSDRLLFGDRDDPYQVMASVSRSFDARQPDAVLPALAQTIAQTLKLTSVTFELLGEDGALSIVAQAGTPRGEPLELALDHAGEHLGRLLVGPRSPGERFTAAERQLLSDVARQVAVAACAVRLTDDLQRSREQLVAAREEERRRLRRDLHDGLGPTLAGMSLQVATARVLLQRDPPAADELLSRLVDESQTAIADVRRLVYALRPPALDELGLVPALRLQAERFPGLTVTVQAPDDIADLPAAVEVAAYRIATEALTNVSRHAAAHHCTITLGLNGRLELDVVDDGAGMAADWRPGVGLTSIRERAAELGGSCVIARDDTGGGTRVRAILPLPAPASE